VTEQRRNADADPIKRIVCKQRTHGQLDIVYRWYNAENGDEFSARRRILGIQTHVNAARIGLASTQHKVQTGYLPRRTRGERVIEGPTKSTPSEPALDSSMLS
jgi:hypothetical protein